MTGREVPVLVVDDDSMVRSWVRLALEGSEFRVAAEASNPAHAIALAERRRPALALVDYRLGDDIGTEVVRALRRAGFTAPVVVMTANPEHGLNELARAAGAEGTVLKTGRPSEFLASLRDVVAGRQSFDSRHPRRRAEWVPLSPRERQVMQLVAEGKTNREIAAALGIGGETVKTALVRTFAKLAVQRRAQAVAVAHERGLL